MQKLITTQAAAQTAADKCHAYFIANNERYAASVKRGGTIAWDIPQQDLATDIDGNLIPNASAKWFIWASYESKPSLTALERKALR
jgi:hypothetical protein